jgi:2',3'-cyclic-nucleotide 2'-phosphodiesterase (5'-nucleotidase family)
MNGRKLSLLGLLAFAPAFGADFTVTFLHVNDTHDRVEPTIIEGKPYGGMARLATLVEKYRKSDPNPIVLHGGDAFQGTSLLQRLLRTGGSRVLECAASRRVPEQPTVEALVEAFQKPIAAQRDRKIAVAAEPLGKNEQLGSIIADSMLTATAKQNVVLAMIQGGGIRAAIELGDITFGSALSVQPFNNKLVVMDVTGKQLQQSIEDIVEASQYRVLYVSKGASYRLQPSKQAGERVTNLVVAGIPMDAGATYRICVSDFLANGGDGLVTLKNSTGYRYDTGYSTSTRSSTTSRRSRRSKRANIA